MLKKFFFTNFIFKTAMPRRVTAVIDSKGNLTKY